MLSFHHICEQNKCVPYWPEHEGSKEVGPYVVTCVSERDATDYKIRVLEITPLDQVASRHQLLLLLHPLSYFFPPPCFFSSKLGVVNKVTYLLGL